jgi:CDP-diacylglycerol--glycerol-3-phosphate 3-phosphatidyltransferase
MTQDPRLFIEHLSKTVESVRGTILNWAQTVARWLAGLGVTPTQVTLAGCALSVTAAVALLLGHPIAAGLLFWTGGSLDMVDGALARLTQQTSTYGAFIDSVLDRIGEGALLLVIAYQFALAGMPLSVAMTILALFGGMMTSYARARAEALGIRCTEGIIARPGRVLLLVFGLLSGLLAPVIYLLALLTCWTMVQRISHVSRTLWARQ